MSTPNPPISSQKETNDMQRKRVPKDFEFGEVIGEGSFSTVLFATEVSTGQTFAVLPNY
jgi:3-phosphoinositide dependent protein kinase-1